MQHSLQILSAGLFALAGAALILLGIARWTREPARVPIRPGPAVLLFNGPDLVDASPAASRLLDEEHGPGSLPALLDLLSRSFGSDLAERVAALAPSGRLRLTPAGVGTLEAHRDGSMLRLTLHPDEPVPAPLDSLLLEATREELALLRGIAEAAPQPIWALDPAGRTVWANRAYLDLVDVAHPGAASQHGAAAEAPALFPSPSSLGKGGVHQRREALVLPGHKEPMWFEVATVPRESGTLHFASDVGALVVAESARLHFVQALAKTFAHLSTGLAIFDRQRRLVLFNPAFMDLTGLPVDFLSGRPLVHSVLDRLREAEMVPEPRDYAAWREEVAALEAAAARGVYNDTWNLPGGRTYRVTGRPHPDGALALLFEDISGEVGLVRHLRAELDTARAALDTMDQATAVFGATGALSLSNAAYAELWGPPPGGADLLGEIERWQAACTSLLSWARLSEAARRRPWNENLRKLDGRDLCLHLNPLPGGATLAAFRPMPIEPKAALGSPALANAFQPGDPLLADAKLADALALEEL